MNTQKINQLIHHPNYSITLQDTLIHIHEGVFSPDPEMTNSSLIILNHLPDVKGKTILDMGTGTGIIAITAAKLGAQYVVAVDINENALINTHENCLISQITNVTFVQSNLFEKVSGTFDIIFANLPIDNALWDSNEPTTHLVENFLRDACAFLNKNGSIYLTWFSISDIKTIKTLLHTFDYKYSVMKEKKFNFIWYLFTIKHRSKKQ